MAGDPRDLVIARLSVPAGPVAQTDVVAGSRTGARTGEAEGRLDGGRHELLPHVPGLGAGVSMLGFAGGCTSSAPPVERASAERLANDGRP